MFRYCTEQQNQYTGKKDLQKLTQDAHGLLCFAA